MPIHMYFFICIICMYVLMKVGVNQFLLKYANMSPTKVSILKIIKNLYSEIEFTDGQFVY